jgi:IclR family KDG regulon transcriptional repressor
MPPSPRSAPSVSPRAGLRRKKKSDYLIQSVANALDVLETLAGGPEEMGVTEVAERLRLHKNNVFRLLATLETRGYVEQNAATENYRLGLMSLELSRGFLQQTRLLRHARAVLEEIARQVGETAHVAIRRGEEAVYLDGVEPERALRVVARPGLARPLHATSEGKCLAAHDSTGAGFDPAAWAARSPARVASHTCVDPERLAEEIKEVASRGWAIDLEESEEGISGLAAPVRDDRGRVVAALSVSGPAWRMDLGRRAEEMAHPLREAAARLSALLGFQEPSRQS